MKPAIAKVNKEISLTQNFQPVLDKLSLFPIYEAFVRPHLDYRDIAFDQISIDSFYQKIETVQYNVALAGTIRET